MYTFIIHTDNDLYLCLRITFHSGFFSCDFEKNCRKMRWSNIPRKKISWKSVHTKQSGRNKAYLTEGWKEWKISWCNFIFPIYSANAVYRNESISTSDSPTIVDFRKCIYSYFDYSFVQYGLWWYRNNRTLK